MPVMRWNLLAIAIAFFVCNASISAADQTPAQNTKPQPPKIDWSQITISQEYIKSTLDKFNALFIKLKFPKEIEAFDKESFTRPQVSDFKTKLEIMVRNPDLEEASSCSKKWFVDLIKASGEIETDMAHFELSIMNSNQQQYTAIVPDLEKKISALRTLLSNPVKLTRDQLATIKEANEKRREKFAEQMKKAQGK